MSMLNFWRPGMYVKISRLPSWLTALGISSLTGFVAFKGRWLRGEEFFYLDRPDNMPAMKEPKRRDSFDRKPPDLRRLI